MATEAQRRDLHEALVAHIGTAAADTLMNLLLPEGWPELARRTDLEVEAARIRSDTAELRGEVRALDARLTGRIDEMDTRLSGKIDALDVRLTGQMAGLHGELAATNARIDAMLAKMIGACVASVTTAAGLAFAAGRFAA